MGVVSNFFFIKAAKFIGVHKLLLYRACYIANLASEAGIEREAERVEKGEEITNRYIRAPGEMAVFEKAIRLFSKWRNDAYF